MDTSQDSPDLLPLVRLARRLRVPQRWLRLEADAGRIPHLRAGSGYLFSVSAVERILAERASQMQGVAS